MQFCVSTAPLLSDPVADRASFEAACAELAEIGIGGLAIPCPAFADGTVTEEGWPERARLTLDVAKRHGFKLCSHPVSPDISTVDSEQRARGVADLTTAIRVLGDAFPEIVVAVHPEDYKPVRTSGDDEARMDACHASLVALEKVAEPLGVRIGLENMRTRADLPNRTGMHLDQLTRIVGDLDSAVVGILLDTGHANISETEPLADTIRRNGSRLVHIHFDDNCGVDDSHLPPGEGNIDFAALFAAVREARYDGTVELEVKVPKGETAMGFYRRAYEYWERVSGVCKCAPG